MSEPRQNVSDVNAADLDSYIHQLEEENNLLKTQNQKLHRDCVSFAKRLKKIQNSGILDVDVESLQRESSEYQLEIARLRHEIDELNVENQSLRTAVSPLPENYTYDDSEQPIADSEIYEPKTEPETESEPVQSEDDSYGMYFNRSPESAEPEQEPVDEMTQHFLPQTGILAKSRKRSEEEARPFELPEEPVPTVKTQSSSARVVKKIDKILLTIVGIIVALSAVFCIFGKSADTTLLGVRFAGVDNNRLSPAKASDVVIYHAGGMDKVTNKDVILYKTNSARSMGLVQSISQDNNATVITVTDDTGMQYNVTKDQYVGKVARLVKGFGGITNFASLHTYSYFAILLAIVLVLIAVLLFLPSDGSSRSRKKKYGRDFTEEDFTI